MIVIYCASPRMALPQDSPGSQSHHGPSCRIELHLEQGGSAVLRRGPAPLRALPWEARPAHTGPARADIPLIPAHHQQRDMPGRQQTPRRARHPISGPAPPADQPGHGLDLGLTRPGRSQQVLTGWRLGYPVCPQSGPTGLLPLGRYAIPSELAFGHPRQSSPSRRFPAAIG